MPPLHSIFTHSPLVQYQLSLSVVVVQVMVWDSLLKDLTAKSPSAVDWYEPPFFIYVIVALMVQCSPTLTLAVVRIRGERIQLWAVCLRREEIAGIGSIEESKHKERKGRAVSWAARALQIDGDGEDLADRGRRGGGLLYYFHT